MNTDFQRQDTADVNRKYIGQKASRLLLGRRRESPVKSEEEAELARYITEAKDEWVAASTSFEHVYDKELVDYYTYRIKACECRYAYFINLAKEKGLTIAISNKSDFVQI